MNNISRMEILSRTEQLIHNELHVNILENSSFSNNMMQIRVHELKDQIQIVIVVCPMDIEQLDDVRMVAELPEEDDFAECALRVSAVAEGVVNAFHRNDAAGAERFSMTCNISTYISTVYTKYKVHKQCMA